MSPISTQTPPSDDRLPDLPLTCLSTAEYTGTADAFKSKNVVIDFWTTRCTRCPSALDQLNELSLRPEYAAVVFASVNLDSCDGARNIIERTEVPRWNSMQHYHMDIEHKEKAKEALGFSQVPFYVVLNEDGVIVMKGGKKKIDFDAVPGMIRSDMDNSSSSFSSSPMEDAGRCTDFENLRLDRPLNVSGFETPVKTNASAAAIDEEIRNGCYSSPISVLQDVDDQRVLVFDEDF